MTVRKRGDASYQVDVFDPNGKRVRRSFRDKQQAYRFEADVLDGRVVDSDNRPTSTNSRKLGQNEVTLKAMFADIDTEEWIRMKDRKGSLANAEMVMDYFGKDRTLSSIGYADVQDFIRSLRLRKNKGGTINRKLAVLSKAFKYGRRHDPSLIKPEIAKQKEGKPRQRVLNETERKQLIDWSWPSPAMRALTIFLIDTGCRIGEALDHDDITVSEVEVDGVTRWACRFDDTKNDTSRQIILTERAVDAYLAYRDELRNKRDADRYRRQLMKARTALGWGDDVIIHTLRHTCLTHLSDSGADDLQLQKWAGHKSLQTTARYVKATTKGMSRMADILERSSKLSEQPKG